MSYLCIIVGLCNFFSGEKDIAYVSVIDISFSYLQLSPWPAFNRGASDNVIWSIFARALEYFCRRLCPPWCELLTECVLILVSYESIGKITFCVRDVILPLFRTKPDGHRISLLRSPPGKAQSFLIFRWNPANTSLPGSYLFATQRKRKLYKPHSNNDNFFRTCWYFDSSHPTPLKIP